MSIEGRRPHERPFAIVTWRTTGDLLMGNILGFDPLNALRDDSP
jgi:hypothetical protein